MQTLLAVNLVAFWAILLASIGGAWLALRIIRQETAALFGLIAGLRTPPADDTTRHFALVKEGKALDPQATLTFYRELGNHPHWVVLSQKYQADTRYSLQRAYSFASEGNQTGAQFFLGAAWYASTQATLPEREVEQSVRGLKATQAPVGTEQQDTASARPSRF